MGWVDTYGPEDLPSLHAHVDFVVCLGGDGLLLHAAGLFGPALPPIISFKLGSLGFLTTHRRAPAGCGPRAGRAQRLPACPRRSAAATILRAASLATAAAAALPSVAVRPPACLPAASRSSRATWRTWCTAAASWTAASCCRARTGGRAWACTSHCACAWSARSGGEPGSG